MVSVKRLLKRDPNPFHVDLLVPSTSTHPNEMFSSSSQSTQEQLLRSQYANEQCDLMSLIKVHEYLTKQQPTTTTTTTSAMSLVDPTMIPSTTPPVHHRSFSTLTSVTYRSSLAKQVLASGQPISTPSLCSHSSSDLPLNHVLQEKSDRQGSVISDIHHLTNSPNTFETSITSNSSLSSAKSNKNHDTLSYLIEQNQRAMQRLITNHQGNPNEESTTILSSASMRIADYESGQLTTISHENTQVPQQQQQKSTLIETGSLSTVDFPSALLHGEDHHHVFETVQFNSKVSLIDCDEIVDGMK